MTANSGVAPCEPWEPIWCTDLPTEAFGVTGEAVQAATEVLWALSGRRFGLCEITLRPCRDDCLGTGTWPFNYGSWWQWGTWPRPLFFNGAWYNIACGSCVKDCSCTLLEETTLPAPVFDIVEVKLDGSPLPSGSYRIDNHRTLVRTDGGVWPYCQDMASADTEVGTWSVTARYGDPVPTLGQYAVGELAAEIAKACIGVDCALPQPVQQIARQGVSVTFLDPNQVFVEGRIGLYRSDLFISSYNPNKLQAASRVYDVDKVFIRRAGT